MTRGGAALIGMILLRLVPTLAIVVTLNFFLLQFAPGDAADVLAAESGSATAEGMAALRQRLGLDATPLAQYLSYLTRLVQLDLGISAKFGVPVLELVLGRLPATLLLMLASLGVALIAGVVLGAVMASRAGRLTDRLLSAVALLFYSMPAFWGALMLILVFAVHLRLLPSSGYQTIGLRGGPFAHIVDVARHLILPATSLSLMFVAIFARLTRASMLEVSGQDHVRTARAKGLPRGQLMRRHVLRNALIPVTTVAGVNFGLLLGGAIVTETVFAWPGLGTLALQAVLARDYAVLLGILLLSSVVVILANVGTDLLQGRLDPRIRRG